nr:uncharacterized protein LOC106145967 isoform X4 [Columba livia]XP_021136332.1 uncharacterized protein LOC106145967 isoform X4 [Columba livia]
MKVTAAAVGLPWWSKQPGSVTSSVPKETMLRLAAAIVGGIVGAAGIAGVGASLVSGNTSTRFLLFKSIPGHGVIFEEVFEGELQPGDILLFPLDRRNGIVSRALFKHAAVYCGDGEVIHFVGTGTAGPSSSQTIPGLISKQGYQTLIKERGQCRIYRKKGGVNLSDFRNRVRNAMRSEANYNAYTNNCIHFALSLLDLLEFYSELVQIRC